MNFSSDFPALCCPLCKGALAEEREQFTCAACQRTYPIVEGIPDFRVFPDPYIGIEEDRQKGKFLAANARDLHFEDLVRFYWSITPDVTDGRDERFMRRVFMLADKWREDLPRIEELIAERGGAPHETVVEMGCGTGGFLVPASERFDQVVGIDIAFRWLVIAKKRLEEVGAAVPLICACAEHLPFKEKQFDFMLAEATLEHLKDQKQALHEGRRVLDDAGSLYLITPNRLSITPEPHVRVWGVGFLPRRWMSPYVQFIKGISYQYLRLLSWFELKSMLQESGYATQQFLLPPIPEAEQQHYSSFEKAQIAVYNWIREVPMLHALLLLIGPLFHVFCRPKGQSD